MKRVLTFLAIMLLPLSVWAMTPVTDSDLSNVTGQAGVNINADLTMNIEIGTMAWGDSSGIDAGFAAYGWTPAGDAGYVGMTGFNIQNLTIRARTNDTYGDYVYPDLLKPITIDVASNGEHGDATYVRIGLGSLEIKMADLDFFVALGESGDNLTDRLGEVFIGGLGIYINPSSYIDIYNDRGDNTCGVTMDLYVKLDHIDLTAMSWGDTDGLPGGNISSSTIDTVTGTVWMSPFANAAGYVGLYDISMGEVIIDGAVNIDVATTAAGIYAHGAPGDPFYAPTAVVHISFGDGSSFFVNVEGPITAFVNLSSVAALDVTGATSTLGDIYISGFGLEILEGSWVDIWAH